MDLGLPPVKPQQYINEAKSLDYSDLRYARNLVRSDRYQPRGDHSQVIPGASVAALYLSALQQKATGRSAWQVSLPGFRKQTFLL